MERQNKLAIEKFVFDRDNLMLSHPNISRSFGINETIPMASRDKAWALADTFAFTNNRFTDRWHVEVFVDYYDEELDDYTESSIVFATTDLLKVVELFSAEIPLAASFEFTNEDYVSLLDVVSIQLTSTQDERIMGFYKRNQKHLIGMTDKVFIIWKSDNIDYIGEKNIDFSRL